jgi:signal transduction histidine kinase
MGAARGFEELKAGVIRTILVRRITLGIFSAVALVVLLTSRVSYLNPVFYSPVLWFLLTFPFKRLIERQRTERRLHWAHAAFFALEILLITALVHFLGGSEWVGNAFYLFTVLYANFFLPRLQGGLVTGWVVACYAGLVLLEGAGILPHRTLFPISGEPYRDLSYNLATILAGAVGIYVVVAFTVRTFAAIYARQNRLLSMRESELARMSRRLLTAQDEERRRIARGLHDGLIQSLAAIKLYLAPERDRLGEKAYREVSGVIDDAIRQTRTLAYSVRPPLLDDLGLVPSLERLASTVSEEGGPAVRIVAESELRPAVGVESLLFYVAREALANVEKHAHAQHAEISLTIADGRARLSIEDDGIGFHEGDAQGLGLRGIEERVALSGGEVRIESGPRRGTRLLVEIPCETGPASDR